MLKKIMTACLSFCLLIALACTTHNVHATDFKGKENQYIRLCSSSKLSSKQQKTCKEFNTYLHNKNQELKEEASQAKEDAKETKDSISDIANKITKIEEKMESAQNELTYVQKNIKNLQEEVAQQSQQLQERLYSMQTSLNSHIYTSYIFGADDFSDFFSRIINIKEITTYDNELIDKINDNIQEVEKQEETLKNLKASLENDKKEQASLKKTFQAQLIQQNKTVADNSSEAAQNQESIEKIQENLAAIQKASDASKVNNVTQATPNKKPKPSQPSQDSSQSQSGSQNQQDESHTDNNNSSSSSDEQLTSSEELGLAIANKALTRQGYMYVWGGAHSWSSIKDPNWTQFDCSGLVNWAHYQAGVRLSRIHYTGSLISAGKGVSRSQLQAGDIILFSSNGSSSGVHHVGIYIGNNQMVHAPSTGKPVQVADLSNSYWQREWYTCRRLY